MASRPRTPDNERPRDRAPATTPEQSENQMVRLATDLAAKQMKDGTASSQVITHFLKLGTEREKLEREKIRSDVELAKAKIEAIESHQKIQELYTEAMQAFKSYSGHDPMELPDAE